MMSKDEKKFGNRDNNAINIMIDMIQKGVRFDDLPVILKEFGKTYTDEVLQDQLIQEIEKSKIFSPYIRLVNLYLEVPVCENEIQFREFFELINTGSLHQNCIYGVVELDFTAWHIYERKDSIPLNNLFEMMLRNKGNCIFILSNLSPILLTRMEESRRFCFLTVKSENKTQILDDYFSRYKLTLTEEEKEQILACLEEHSAEQWTRILNSAVMYLYQKDSELDIDVLREKITMTGKQTMGFRV